MGLIKVARAGSFFAKDPGNDRRRIMAPHKSNLAEKPPSLVYKIVTSPVHDTARIEWMGVSEYGADALAADATTPHERTQLDEAKDFLRAGLECSPVRAKQVYKDARDAGIAERTLQRAKDVLRVRSEKVGTEGWSWQLHDKSEGNHTAGGGDVGDLPLNKGNEAQNTSGKGEGRLGHQGRQGGEHVLDRRLTEDEAQRVQRLASQGMKPEKARAEVLARGVPR